MFEILEHLPYVVLRCCLKIGWIINIHILYVLFTVIDLISSLCEIILQFCFYESQVLTEFENNEWVLNMKCWVQSYNSHGKIHKVKVNFLL